VKDSAVAPETMNPILVCTLGAWLRAPDLCLAQSGDLPLPQRWRDGGGMKSGLGNWIGMIWAFLPGIDTASGAAVAHRGE
jgi:hypothetical protein